jgi:16S rRNA processing protein RimM
MGAELWVLGRVTGVFGVRGELRLWLDNPDSSWLYEQAREVVLRADDGRERALRLKARPGAGRRILGRVEGFERREQAEALVGWEILAPRDALPELDDGSWYVEDLIGLSVFTDRGRALGELVEVHQGAPVEVWEILGPEGTSYVPVLLERILEVGESILVRDDGVVEGE